MSHVCHPMRLSRIAMIGAKRAQPKEESERGGEGIDQIWDRKDVTWDR
jgi:hypothetical protein